jgi:hypothetical protein
LCAWPFTRVAGYLEEEEEKGGEWRLDEKRTDQGHLEVLKEDHNVQMWNGATITTSK